MDAKEIEEALRRADLDIEFLKKNPDCGYEPTSQSILAAAYREANRRHILQASQANNDLIFERGRAEKAEASLAEAQARIKELEGQLKFANEWEKGYMAIRDEAKQDRHALVKFTASKYESEISLLRSKLERAVRGLEEVLTADCSTQCFCDRLAKDTLADLKDKREEKA